MYNLRECNYSKTSGNWQYCGDEQALDDNNTIADFNAAHNNFKSFNLKAKIGSRQQWH